MEQDITGNAKDEALPPVLRRRIQPDTGAEPVATQYPPQAEKALLVDVHLHVGGDHRPGVAGICGSLPHQNPHQADHRVGVAVVPGIGGGVDDQPPVGLEDPADLPERPVQFPRVEVLHDVKQEHPVKGRVGEGQAPGIGLVDTRRFPVRHGLPGEGNGGRRVVNPVRLGAGPGAVAQNLPPPATHV